MEDSDSQRKYYHYVENMDFYPCPSEVNQTNHLLLKKIICLLHQQRDSSYSRMGSARESPIVAPSLTPRNHYKQSGSKGCFPSDVMEQVGSQHYHAGLSGYGTGGPKAEASSMDASRTTTSSRDGSVSVSNASDLETEWVEQDEPGVYITIRQLSDGTRELRRVRFR